MLKDIAKPADIKKLSQDQLKVLAQELRQEIIEVVSRNGGHLASNLGAVELTIALHYVFDCPEDKLVFDVGHQTYAHKLLTGRQAEFRTLRTKGGISGFSRLEESEYDAFTAYCRIYPTNATLLVDTYNTLKSGIPNAIRAFNDVLKPLGITKCGIRLDSGDIAYLTRQARKMLDEAGWTECAITASNSLDERLITELLRQDAKINSFGVGERLITSKSDPVFGGVYKLCAVEEADGTIVPKIKVSENVGKITNPGFKKLYRFYDRETGMAEADYICLRDEVVDDSRPLEICDPQARWKRKLMENFQAVELQVPVFLGGKLVYELPSLKAIKTNCAYQVSTLWPEVKRFDYPHQYYVDLSEKLMELKDHMLAEHGRKAD